MRLSVKELTGYAVHATDGDFGKVDNFYFDDKSWVIRYIVVNTGGWLSEKKVLISPVAIQTPDLKMKLFRVNLTKDQIARSPDIDTDKTISHQHEIELHRHYEWPEYWEGSLNLTGGGFGSTLPIMGFQESLEAKSEDEKPETGYYDPNLRSSSEACGYDIQAKDGKIGHVYDFILDDKTLRIKYVIVDTRNWIPGRKVLIAPKWIKDVSWENGIVSINFSMEEVRKSPEYNPSALSPNYENDLDTHYGNLMI